MIILKDLAKEFKADCYDMRRLLRKEFGYAPKGRRWKWDEKDKELKKIRAFLSKSYLNGTGGSDNTR